MSKKRYSPEQVIGKLREAEVLIAKGQSISQTAKTLGITDQTYYRWRQGGPRGHRLASGKPEPTRLGRWQEQLDQIP